jgi:Zn-dependent M28 family amino/carboxypeptidase
VPGSEPHSKCAEFIENKLKEYNADSVIVQRSSTVNFKGHNIPIINIMGQYNVDATKRVLLLAHWDTRPWADNDPDEANREKPVPGANDGGSGVAVLLEMARLMGEKRPDVGVDLLFVDAEDSGNSSSWDNNEDTWCLGTQYWANNMPYTDENRPKYGILLDMVGGQDAVFYREYISEKMAPRLNDKIWQMAALSGYENRFVSKVRGGVTDDHIFINKAGIPCIDVIECSNEETGTFNPTWHTINDDLRHIDRTTLKAVGQTMVNTVYAERP